MRKLYQLTKIINKLIYRQQFEKRYYFKAPPVTENLKTISVGRLNIENRIALALIGFLIFIPIFSQFLKSQSYAEVYDLKLYPAPSNSPYLYQNTVNGFKVYLGTRLDKKKPQVRFEEKNSSVEFAPNFDQPLNNNSQLSVNKNSLLYKNVLPGVDLKYSLNGKGVKEEIIINNQASSLKHQEFNFSLSLQNAVPKKSLEGETQAYFIEPINEEYRFHVPKPFMIDAAGSRSEAVELKINQLSSLNNEGGQNIYLITLIPNQEWLAKAVYPVTIDPSVVHDESSEFSGTTNRIEDEGSGTTPKLRTPYHELPADEHTVGLWHMNETSNDSCSGGQDACDSSGNGNHGTATGTTIETSNQKLGTAARNFNGSSDYVNIPDGSTIDVNQQVTVEAWVKTSTTTQGARVASKWGDTSAEQAYLLVIGWSTYPGRPRFAVGTPGTTTADSPVHVNDNTWHHIAGTYDGSTVKIYVDGKETASTAASGSITNGTGALRFGVEGDGSSGFYDGIIDEVRISDVARTAEEIKQDAQRFPYGVYTSDTVDLTSGVGTLDSVNLKWTDNVSTPGATLDGWSNFKPVIIDNTQNSSTLTNYQTKVQVDYDSNMQSDFDDLRFTSNTATVSAYGNETDYSTEAPSTNNSLDFLDSTHFAIAYRRQNASGYGAAKVGTVSGTTISYGSEYNFNEDDTTYTALIALDSTHFVVAYRDDQVSTGYGYAKIGTVSGTTISYGSEYLFNQANNWDIKVDALDSTHFVVIYQDYGGDDYGCAKIGTVSGTTISYGSEYCFNETATDSIDIVTVDSTHFIVAYRDNGGDDYGCAKVGTVSGTTISYGSEYCFNSAFSTYIDLTMLGSTHLVVVYRDEGGSYYGCAKVGTVSGTTISYGSEYCYTNVATTYNAAVTLDSTTFAVGYDKNSTSGPGSLRLGKALGTVISFGPESYYNDGWTDNIELASSDSRSFVISYEDKGDDYHGESRVASVINTNLDYWIEEKSDGVEAKVWVEVDTIPASDLTTIWMWYGNSAASAGSSITNTFPFGDDFPGSSLDGTKWPNTSGSPVVSGGNLQLDAASGVETVRSNVSFSRPSIMEFRFKQSDNDNLHRAGFSNSSAGTSYANDDSAYKLGYFYFLLGMYDDYNSRASDEGTSGSVDNKGTEDTGWHNYKIVLKSSPTNFYVDNSFLSWHNLYIPDEACYVRLEEEYNADAAGLFYVDWVFVRKYASPEPIAEVGADIEFQTRTSSDGSTWEAWKPTTNETQIDSLDKTIPFPHVDNSDFNWASTSEAISLSNDISYGSETTYNSATTNHLGATALDSSHIVVGYRDDGDANYGCARVGVVSGTSISYGTENCFNEESTLLVRLTTLDSTHFVVVYKDNSQYGCARVGVVSGTSISYGTENCFNQAVTDYIEVATLDSSHFVAAYKDDGGLDYGCARVGVVSGTSISYGTENCFNQAVTDGVDIASLDSTHFVAEYKDTGGAGYGCAKVGLVSGTTISSYGTENCFNQATTVYAAAAALDSTHFVAAYKDDGGSDYGCARVGVVSGTTISSYGTENCFDTQNSIVIKVNVLDPDHFVVGWKEQTSDDGVSKIGTVGSDSSISYGDKSVFNSGNTWYIALAPLDTTRFAVAFNEDYLGGTDYGMAKIGTLPSPYLRDQEESTIKMEGDGSMIATVGAQMVDANTVALWHLEETNSDLAGDDVFDETNNNHDGEFNGSDIDTAVVDGIYGKTREFDGTDDYIYIDSLTWTPTIFSVEWWLYPQSHSDYNQMLSGGGWGKFVFHTTATGGVYVGIDVATRMTPTDIPAGTVQLNQWQHFAFTFDNGTGKFYKNGALLALKSGMSNPTAWSGFYIGSNTTSTIDGYADEVRISNVARTSEEIAEAYRAGRDHRLQRTISSTDLSSKSKVPFYFAADKQGTIAETYVGETDHAVYGSDSNTKGLWHLDEKANFPESVKDASNNGNNGLPGSIELDTFEGGIDGWSYRDGNWSNPPTQDCATSAVGSCSIKMTDTDGGAGSNYISTKSYSSSDTMFNIRYKCESGALWGVMVYDGGTWNCIKGSGTTDCGGSFSAIGSFNPSVTCDNTWRQATYDLGAGRPGYTISQTIIGDWDSQAANKWMWFDQFQIYHDSENPGTQGKIGGARYFDGTDDYIEVGDQSSLEGFSNLSIEAWVKLDSLPSSLHYVIVAKEGIYKLDVNTNGTLRFLTGNDWGGSILTSTNAISPGSWYHIAATYNGSTKKMYINGEVDPTTVSTSGGIGTNTFKFGIGAWDTGSVFSEFLAGIVDEVRISDTARSTDEIRLAYQYGLRTHQVNVDFKASLDSGNLIANSSDYSFTVDATVYGLENMGDSLYVGDKVIVKENYNGTNYIAQGDVTAVTASTGTVTVDGWDTGSTFPSGGYTANATVFKWQREYWDINDISPADRNATTKLGLRILDANEGFTMYLDDFESNTNYLTDNSGSAVTSTLNRYIQYRAILSTNNIAVTPELTSVTLDYNRKPTAPTSLLTNDLTNPGNVTDTTPYFSAIYNDPDEGDVANKYQIQVDDNSDFGSTIWDSGSSGTAMTDCPDGTRCEDITYGGASTDLQWGTRYYWRIKYWDEDGAEGDWSAEEALFVMKTIYRPAVCVMDDGSQPGEIIIKWEDETDLETGYRIEKDIDGAGFNYLTDKAVDATSHLDNSTSAEHTYQYRIRAESNNGNSEWCTTAPVDFSTGSFRFEGVQMEGIKID